MILSVFVQQEGTVCDFSGKESWVILTPIEQSIKRKIEAVGTPLKDWDIQINYGIKTGYNEAFIVNTAKRDEILANCKTEDERQRTAELIRPILRGRDIKRYSYDWAELWLIATFPSRHYDIEQYPAVKEYLLSFGMERLEQTGKTYIINGKTVKARKKTNNKWFETQDSISYWEDFNKPKVIYPETTQGAFFAYDKSGIMIDKTCFMLIADYASYIQRTLSSRLFSFSYKKIYSSVELGEHGYQYNKHALIKLPLIVPTDTIRAEIENCKTDAIDQYIYSLYGISINEVESIEKFNLP